MTAREKINYEFLFKDLDAVAVAMEFSPSFFVQLQEIAKESGYSYEELLLTICKGKKNRSHQNFFLLLKEQDTLPLGQLANLTVKNTSNGVHSRELIRQYLSEKRWSSEKESRLRDLLSRKLGLPFEITNLIEAVTAYLEAGISPVPITPLKLSTPTARLSDTKNVNEDACQDLMQNFLGNLVIDLTTYAAAHRACLKALALDLKNIKDPRLEFPRKTVLFATNNKVCFLEDATKQEVAIKTERPSYAVRGTTLENLRDNPVVQFLQSLSLERRNV